MDLILISDEKLKIILSENDMKRLNIDIETLDYSNVATKKVFWEILDEAKVKAGFNADKSKLYVQVFPSGDGGCEMFVTKFSGVLQPSNSLCKKKTYRMTPTKQERQENGIFLVLGFDELCKLCRRIARDKILLSTSLYYDLSGEYILTIEENRKTPSYISNRNNNSSKIPDYVSEYGNAKILSDRLWGYVNEHCKKIADDNAVQKLSTV